MNQSRSLQFITKCALLAAICCICSPISIGIGAVPISLATFAVMLTGVILPPAQAVTSIALFLALGMCGLPVFSGYRGGFAVIFGPTGGYIWSYPLMVLCISLFGLIKINKYIPKIALILAGCAVGSIVCYLCGTIQFAAIAGTTFADALKVCVLPFVILDFVKAVVAAVVGERISRIITK